jgi:uncharacterized OB-fold protein
VSDVVGRPNPSPDALTAGFWDAAAAHRLVIQRCTRCGTHRHYPQPRCGQCLDEGWEWAEVSGHGTVYTFTVTHQAFHPYWRDKVPYAVATIELDEGVRVMSDLPPGDEERVAIGAEVEVFFEDGRTDDGTPVTFPRFRLV